MSEEPWNDFQENVTDISLHSLLLSLEIYTNSIFCGKDLIVSTRNFYWLRSLQDIEPGPQGEMQLISLKVAATDIFIYRLSVSQET